MAVAPTLEQTKRALLDEIAVYKANANEIFPIVQINVKMQEKGFSVEDINLALEEMVKDGLLIPSDGPHWKLSETGYAEL